MEGGGEEDRKRSGECDDDWHEDDGVSEEDVGVKNKYKFRTRVDDLK